jgi:antitoxin ParD1/3/4
MPTRNVNLTAELDRFVRKKVGSGRYENASEVVRAALRQMEREEDRELRLAQPAAEDILANLSDQENNLIRQRVLAGIESIEHGEYTDYEGRPGLRTLASRVKARGRARLTHLK